MNFKYKIGDTVVCINNMLTPLKEGQYYIVSGYNGPCDLTLKGLPASWRRERFLPANLTPLEKVIYGLS